MGTIEEIFEEWESISKVLSLPLEEMTEEEEDAIRDDIIKRIDKNRARFATFAEQPSIIRNLQDKTQPKR